ncbi:creatininase family protein [Micromonospora cathayae]|uniref:Creatininase family protein n=1 Tax=Micromonospora cathayae TaxID=3028804 RepID=A0ABY7ZPW3_9ACTN|nr:creatininase family protein [Micromonospora sp. HUAS 3]WDZ85072.1 creatininase family protein [Micromonospora sp. HUAS 3]
MKIRSPWSRNLAELSSATVAEAVRGGTLIWPLGSIEQHGPHLPLAVDTVIPEALAQQLAFELDGYRLPVQPIGARSLPQSGGGPAFPGTLHLRGDTLIRYLTETLESLCHLPFHRLILLNGHFENEALIFEAVDDVRQRGLLDGREAIAFSWWSLVTDAWLNEEVAGFPGWHAEHAGVTETSLMLFLRPDLVSPERPEHHNPPLAGIYLHPADPTVTTNQGVLSSTVGASQELGERLFWHVISGATALVRQGPGMRRPAAAEPAAAAEPGGAAESPTATEPDGGAESGGGADLRAVPKLPAATP